MVMHLSFKETFWIINITAFESQLQGARLDYKETKEIWQLMNAVTKQLLNVNASEHSGSSLIKVAMLLKL